MRFMGSSSRLARTDGAAMARAARSSGSAAALAAEL
jgi:hypothetical protein